MIWQDYGETLLSLASDQRYGRFLSTKRELVKRGGRAGSNRTEDTNAEMNPQVSTGASSFGDDCGSNPVEATK
ncbi:hypothetical protein T01_197 [Trichinella spiralis]|uniref:Uncharacterized protein n=1 Tax=Trichinella spiralis TaxID=6334 RepID=A0A0V1B502_TRISP|nr:hypothetical protein T01_197 [Trichinella spiralis]